jgi:tetratricopeptide (TPR) repeat protein
VTTGTPIPGRTGPTFTSEREKAQKAIEEFQKVADQYGDPYREMAKFFIAVNMLQVERAKGLEQLGALTKSGNDEVAARAKFALAQAKEAGAPGEDRDRQYEEAVALYSELLKDKDSPVPADTLNFRIASVRERQGRKDEAADILFKLVEESRKAKGKDGKPAAPSATAREASNKLKTLSPERFAQLTPDAGKPELPF